MLPSTSTRPSKDGEDCESGRSENYASYRKSTKSTQDATKYKISEYVNRVSGVSRQEDDSQPDHTYAKSSIWRPQNYLVEPCRYLFSTAGPSGSRPSDDCVIDVETVDEEPVVPLPRQLVASEADPLPEVEATCWADKISKSGWSPVQIRILPKVLRIIEDIRLHRLAFKGRPNERFHLEDALDCGRSKLSYLLASVGWDKSVTQWLHSLLTKHLTPVEREDYLAVLGLVKSKSAAPVDKMVAPVHFGRSATTKEERSPCVVPARSRLDNRVAEVLLDEKFTKLPRDPVFFLIPNSLECAKTERFSMFVAQLRQMAYVYVVNCPPRGKATVQQGLDQTVAETRARLAETRSNFSGRPVVAIGWNLGAAIACLLAQLEPVQAVICLGYPFKTVDGNHRRSNLSAVEMTCPVLFVVGARSILASQEEMEDLRSQMKVPNELVVVGGCNDQLIMSRKDRSNFLVTQSMVDRSLVVEIYNFVGELLTQPPPVPPPRPSQHAVPQTTVVSRFPVASYKKKFKEHVPCKPSIQSVMVNSKRINSPPKRKPRATPAQKLIVINSAKYMSLIPHHNYASKLQPMLAGSQGYQRSCPPN